MEEGGEVGRFFDVPAYFFVVISACCKKSEVRSSLAFHLENSQNLAPFERDGVKSVNFIFKAYVTYGLSKFKMPFNGSRQGQS